MLRNKNHISLLLLCFILLATACKMPDENDNHLSPERMANLMVDIHLAETYSTLVKDSTHTPGKKNPDSLAAFYKDIFAHHHTTMEEFSKSLTWYKAHPNEMDSLYNGMIPIISKFQQ